MSDWIQIILIVGFPLIAKRIARQPWARSWLSAVVQCYALGILLRNTSFLRLNDGISTTFSEFSIVMAIPLLLYSTNVFQWYQKSKEAFLSFGLFVLSGILSVLICTFLYAGAIDQVWEVGGMTMGLYTGGTPNMQAIGMAIEAEQERIILINTADILVGGIYLIFLTTFAHRFFGLFLARYKTQQAPVSENPLGNESFNWRGSISATSLTLLVIGLSLGFTWLIHGNISNSTTIMLTLTTFAILASFSKTVRSWESTFETAEYFLLIFSVALGMLADFSVLVDHGKEIILFTGFALIIAVIIHTALSAWFGIDRDTTIVIATAALYGPPFVGQIVSVIGNKNVAFSGIIMGLFGYMIGNYLGIGMAYLLSWFGLN